MPQAANNNQTSAAVRQPLSMEQAREIATKSYQRLKAQGNVQSPPPMPENVQPQKPKGIQIQLVKRAQSLAAQSPSQRPTQTEMPAVRTPPPMPEDSPHTTQEGLPDKRFSENRPQQPTQKRRDSIGVRLTKDGKPDRRYLESQHLSSNDAEIERAKNVLRQAGITQVD